MVFFLLDTQVEREQNPRRFFEGAASAGDPWGIAALDDFTSRSGGSDGVFAWPDGAMRERGVRGAGALAACGSSSCRAMLELRFAAAECTAAIGAALADAAEAAIKLSASGTLRDSTAEFGCGKRPRSPIRENLRYGKFRKAPRNRGLSCF